MHPTIRSALVALMLVAFSATANAQEGHSNAEASALLQQAQGLYEDGQYALAAQKYLEFRDMLIQIGNDRAPVALYNAGLALSHLPDRQCEGHGLMQRFINDSHALSDVAEVRDMRSEAQVKMAELEARGCSASSGGGGGGIWVPGVILAAVGAAAAIAGGVVGGIAMSDSDAVAAICGGDISMCPMSRQTEIQNAADSAYTLANVADGLLFGGLAVAAAGVVLMFVLADSGESASAGAMCTQDGCAATVRGTF